MGRGCAGRTVASYERQGKREIPIHYEAGRKDVPLRSGTGRWSVPEHYEPYENPVEKNPMSKQVNNPAIKIFKSDMDKLLQGIPNFRLYAARTARRALVLGIIDPLAAVAP